MSNKENENTYLKSLADRGLQEQIYINTTQADFLQSVNSSKINSIAPPSASSSQLPVTQQAESEQVASGERNKKIEQINQFIGKDGVFLNESELSVGTIIKRKALLEKLVCESPTSSQLALIECGMNNIVDLTHGTLTNQNMLFSKQDWDELKIMFPFNFATEDIESARVKLKKGKEIFKETQDTEECYWNAKHYQRKATRSKEKLGYELISVLLDKMLKHQSIFSLSQPTPSEADVMIKVWSDIFEALFFNTGIYIRWGEKGLNIDDNSRTIFKLDAKLVFIYDSDEYPVSAIEFAPYAGPKKIKTDRSKLLVEGKVLYNKIMSLNINEEHAKTLSIINIQIMGLESHAVTINLVDDELYTGSTIKSFILPSTASEFSKNYKDCINNLFDLKAYTLKTAEIIKQTLNNKKKSKKSMKRKLQESSDDGESGPSKPRISPCWRHTAKS